MSLVPPGTMVRRAFNPEISYSLRDRLWRAAGGKKKAGNQPSAQPRKPSLADPVKRAVRGLAERCFVPDPQVVWVPAAIRAGGAIISRHKIDTVLVTTPPFSSVRVGIELKRRFPSVRLITEFRDEWLDFYLSIDTSSNSRKRLAAEHWERESAVHSDFVVAVTDAQRDAIRNRYTDQPAAKFLAIPNGYLPEQFAGFVPRARGDGKLVVTFFGTVYPYTSPGPFLEAMEGLPEELRSRIEVRFIGRVSPEESATLEAHGGMVRQMGFMPHSQALHWLEETDCLLLPVDNATAHAGKLFEYLATGKPILAISPTHGEIASLIRSTGAGWCADPADAESIRGMVTRLYECLREGRPTIQPNREAVREYERPRLVSRLVRETGLGEQP